MTFIELLLLGKVIVETPVHKNLSADTQHRTYTNNPEEKAKY